MKTLKTTLCVIVIIFAANLFFVKNTYAQEAVGLDKISTYVVRQGDTLGEIAEKFSITTNTVLSANNLKKDSKIKIGQKLVILPVSGIQYKVKSGDALESIARRFKTDKQEIIAHNNLEKPYLIKKGEVILIPDETSTQIINTSKVEKITNTVVKTTKGIGKKVASFFVKPVKAAVKTQGIHGKNGVDLAAKEDTPILAAAGGKVTVSQTGWNGGYGNYVVITHNNGLQTLYAHNNENLVSVGDKVIQGQIIAHMGSTGKSTGSHVHFEVRGGKNPF